jgi:hypothetical protein
MKHHHPGTPALVLSMHDESLYAERALRAGARVRGGAGPARHPLGRNRPDKLTASDVAPQFNSICFPFKGASIMEDDTDKYIFTRERLHVGT